SSARKEGRHGPGPVPYLHPGHRPRPDPGLATRRVGRRLRSARARAAVNPILLLTSGIDRAPVLRRTTGRVLPVGRVAANRACLLKCPPARMFCLERNQEPRAHLGRMDRKWKNVALAAAWMRYSAPPTTGTVPWR